MTLTLTTTEHVEQQAEKHDRAAARQADWMRACTLPTPAEYEPPRSDDPREWTGLLAYTYHDWLYREHCMRAYILRHFGKPLACGECGGCKGTDHHLTHMLCLDHAWDSWGYDEAVGWARGLGRRGSYKGPVSSMSVRWPSLRLRVAS